MNARVWCAVLLCAGLGVVSAAQEAPVPGDPVVPGRAAPGSPVPGARGQGGWRGQPEGRGMGMGFGQGTVGTVTEAAADHFMVKTELGEVYKVYFSVNTRLMKQPPGGPSQRQGGRYRGAEPGEEGAMRTPPQPIKAAEIKVGDVIAASGEVDANAKTLGAVFVMLIDPERAKEMRAMEANYGKTWLAGRVKAIEEVKVSLDGGPDRAVHSFVADENTTFRKRRDPITLADVQVGDMVRVEGAVKDGTFVATTVSVMTPPPNGPRGGDEPGQPPAAGPQ